MTTLELASAEWLASEAERKAISRLLQARNTLTELQGPQYANDVKVKHQCDELARRIQAHVHARFDEFVSEARHDAIRELHEARRALQELPMHSTLERP
jgi:hypothetical protein